MKVAIILIIFLIIFLLMTIRIKIYKFNQEKINVNLFIFRFIPIKLHLMKFSPSLLMPLKQNHLVSNKRKLLSKHLSLIKKFIGIFSANNCFFSLNSEYYLSNLSLYLSTFYLYSLMQNLLYINLLNIKRSCFKSRIKTVDMRLEIDLELETKGFRILAFMIRHYKELLEIYQESKYERTSNIGITKNING